eukprot:TRINITY_DN1238_c0_g1_i1.p1 TRINITY_DN1238_c0_g1~~TRINITY_DN1238_c0_g1_i1.p1  ORF type:complete len:139 (+),score=41.46 TRINITY_DN1238_c0_g1_i1:106-522(+)
MIRRPPRSTQSRSSAASDVYKRQVSTQSTGNASWVYQRLGQYETAHFTWLLYRWYFISLCKPPRKLKRVSRIWVKSPKPSKKKKKKKKKKKNPALNLSLLKKKHPKKKNHLTYPFYLPLKKKKTTKQKKKSIEENYSK